VNFINGSKVVSAALDPEKTEAMLEAFEDAWHSLKASGDVLASDFRAPSTREALAKAIIKHAQGGEADPARLKAYAVTELLANIPRM
jgi:hypothetical protein